MAAAVALSLVCSVLSLVFLVLNAQTQWALHALLGGLNEHSDSHYERPDPGLLERPSSYVGLDKLPPELLRSTLPDVLDVFPPLFQPVDHIHRNYVFPTDDHARFTFNGRVTPGDHRILLTDHVRGTQPLVIPQSKALTDNDGRPVSSPRLRDGALPHRIIDTQLELIAVPEPDAAPCW